MSRPIIFTVKRRTRIMPKVWGTWYTAFSAKTREEIDAWLATHPAKPDLQFVVFYNRKKVAA